MSLVEINYLHHVELLQLLYTSKSYVQYILFKAKYIAHVWGFYTLRKTLIYLVGRKYYLRRLFCC